MRPPICAICKRWFEPDSGSLVSFARDPAEAAWYTRAAKPGFIGHPPHQEWFCGAHVEAARGLAERTRAEALRHLRG